MKLGIQSRLFLAYSSVILIVVLAMMVAVNWSFQRGLGDYLHQVENERLDKIAATLASAYGEVGDWSFIRHNPRVWSILLDQALGQSGTAPKRVFPHPSESSSARLRPGPPPPGSDDERMSPSDLPPAPRDSPPFPGSNADPPVDAAGLNHPPRPGMHGRAMPPHGASDFRLRLRLLDGNDHPVFGPPDAGGAETRRDVNWHGQKVGYLVLRENSEIVDELAEGFELDQRRTYIFIALLALLLAMVASMILARRLLKPVHEVAAGARALGSGAYETRIETTRTDELGLLADDFNRLALTLAQNEEVRQRWIADISHELRTPLAVLRSEIEALVDGIREPTPDRLLSLKQEVLSISELVNDLYELALSDIGALDYRREPLDLAEIIAQSTDAFGSRFTAGGLTLHNAVEHPLPMIGDHRRLQQLFTNLLENSQRYTRSGGRVEIVVEHANGECHIVVQDSDPGVPDEALPQLFDRLYRVDKSRSRQLGGAGLGLAICRNIVSAHSGHIEAGHSPLGGLAIHIRLPLNR
jgi:two-component system sensor histidine kinase BaeS